MCSNSLILRVPVWCGNTALGPTGWGYVSSPCLYRFWIFLTHTAFYYNSWAGLLYAATSGPNKCAIRSLISLCMFVQLLVMTSLSEYMWLCRSQWVRQLHVLLFSRNKKTQGRCHRCLFKHPASSNSSIVSLSLCYTTGLNATQAIEALSPIMLPVLWPTDTTKYWQQRSSAVVQSLCVRLCWYKAFLFFANPPPLKSCWLQEYILPLFICQNSPPSSLLLLLFPTMLNCCDTVALERLVLKYSFLMTNEHVDRFLSLAGH